MLTTTIDPDLQQLAEQLVAAIACERWDEAVKAAGELGGALQNCDRDLDRTTLEALHATTNQLIGIAAQARTHTRSALLQQETTRTAMEAYER